MFPNHLYSRPPYELDPAIFWLQLRAESGKGMERVLQRYGGRPLALQSLNCQRDTVQITSGPTRVWSPFRAGDSVETHRLFGSIIERDGRAKLMSLATDF